MGKSVQPFVIDKRPGNKGLVALLEMIGIMTELVQGLKLQHPWLTHIVENGPEPLCFSIDSKKGEAQSAEAKFASAAGTNLEMLDEDEIAALTRHDWALIEHRIREYAPELI